MEQFAALGYIDMPDDAEPSGSDAMTTRRFG